MLAFTKENVDSVVCKTISKIFHYGYEHYGLTSQDYPRVRIHMKDDNSFYEFKDFPYVKVGVKMAASTAEYHEYEHIQSDPEIGAFVNLVENADGSYSVNWVKYVVALVCHEMAHLIEELSSAHVEIEGVKMYSVDSIKDEDQRQHHGDRWQAIYRVLRNEFCNNL